VRFVDRGQQLDASPRVALGETPPPVDRHLAPSAGRVQFDISVWSSVSLPTWRDVANDLYGRTGQLRKEREPLSAELRELPVTGIGEEDILLKVHAVAICGSDLHQYTGKQKGVCMTRLIRNGSAFLPYVLIFGVAFARLIAIHPGNFIPMFSCILFFGAARPKREFPIPLFALVGVDIFLTLHKYAYPLDSSHVVTWMWYLAVILLGGALLRGSKSVPFAIGTSLAASVSFFLASNFAVWAAWNMYPKTWSGLGACYVAALPFFRNAMSSETIFTLVIFGISRYYEVLMPPLRADVHVLSSDTPPGS